MMMKRLSTLLVATLLPMLMLAQGWPENYAGVMLQGFYWDSYTESQWVKLEKQADELSQYFSLVWIPQSANCGGTSMGYDDLYWFTNYSSSFGNETELRSMISTFKSKGLGTIADVVINHRKNVSNWVDFPKEVYNGETYQLVSTDICANDDGGATKTWATANGYQLSANNDTGEDWGGMRDLDHNSENVQKNVKAYLNMLLNDLGYTGFRYDMVKGYGAKFTGIYNSTSNPQFSVGEYWDGNAATVKNWINGTKVNDVIQSAAFDFPFRYTVRDAINGNNWTKLANASLVSDNNYKRYSVTFVENHDTEYRSSTAQQDPIRKDTLAANAFLLAMPGTPCVFFKHWIDCKKDIKAMIDVRRAAGIHNQSATVNYASKNTYYAVCSTGTTGKLLAVVGSGADAYTPNSNFVKILSGYHYVYYLEKSMETAWADLSSGEYDGAQQVLLTAVSANAGAQLVYTTNGTTPTASSTKVSSGTSITIEGDVVLKVGLLVNGAVSGIVTRTYTKAAPVESRTINVYVNTDNVEWTSVNFWTWGGDGTHGPAGEWPGDKVNTTTTVNGRQWFCHQYTLHGSDDFVNFVFSTGSGSPQTVDINNVADDAYFEISTEKDGDKYKVNNVTDQQMGIDGVLADAPFSGPVRVCTADGRLLRVLPAGTGVSAALAELPRGLYIVNSRKYVK